MKNSKEEGCFTPPQRVPRAVRQGTRGRALHLPRAYPQAVGREVSTSMGGSLFHGICSGPCGPTERQLQDPWEVFCGDKDRVSNSCSLKTFELPLSGPEPAVQGISLSCVSLAWCLPLWLTQHGCGLRMSLCLLHSEPRVFTALVTGCCYGRGWGRGWAAAPRKF